MGRRAALLLLAVLVMGLTTAPTALAVTPGPTSIAHDTFPLTGFQLLIAGIIAVVLIAGGIVLRRLSRSQRP